ncbi:MAG TPA: ribosome maturation factor RimP [Polyangiaceae bacterium]|nr:ribosome maturation factor RimP [Polyangiaceae bacterium]
MTIAHEKLPGLDRERVLAAVVPILAAHRVDAVELMFKTDSGGWVLQLTIEKPGERMPGAGITVDLCSEISRELSTALDVADCIPHRYRLEVGSPGVERALYSVSDYERFAGQPAKLKLKKPRNSEYVLIGTLSGASPEQRIVIQTERGELVELSLDEIDNGHLVFDWKSGGSRPGGPKAARRPHGREQRSARRR